jgi:hypothetical protein
LSFERVCDRVSGDSGRVDNTATYDICELRLSNQVLGLGSDHFLLQSDNSGALWLPHLRLLDVIEDLLLVVSAGLNALLGVSDCFQKSAGVVDVMRIDVLLLAQLCENNPNLVGELRDGIVTSLFAPFGELGSDVNTLLACNFVCTDQVVFSLDELKQLS